MRRASPDELKKDAPTYKDLDFLQRYYVDEMDQHYDTQSLNLVAHPLASDHFAKFSTWNSSAKSGGISGGAAAGAGASSSSSAGQHSGGLYLHPQTYDVLVYTLERDCRVLESFHIMDYSLLVGVHNYDRALREGEQLRVAGKDGGYVQFDYDKDEELP